MVGGTDFLIDQIDLDDFAAAGYMKNAGDFGMRSILFP